MNLHSHVSSLNVFCKHFLWILIEHWNSRQEYTMHYKNQKNDINYTILCRHFRKIKKCNLVRAQNICMLQCGLPSFQKIIPFFLHSLHFGAKKTSMKLTPDFFTCWPFYQTLSYATRMYNLHNSLSKSHCINL